MKQEVLIKMCWNSPMSRAKALKIAVAADGVVSVALKGEDRNHIEICGEDIDSADLVMLLRKKVCYTEIVSVKVIDEKEEDTKNNTSSAAVIVQDPMVRAPNYPYGQVQYCYDPSSSCTIM